MFKSLLLLSGEKNKTMIVYSEEIGKVFSNKSTRLISYEMKKIYADYIKSKEGKTFNCLFSYRTSSYEQAYEEIKKVLEAESWAYDEGTLFIIIIRNNNSYYVCFTSFSVEQINKVLRLEPFL
jgi:hypothetical protein